MTLAVEVALNSNTTNQPSNFVQHFSHAQKSLDILGKKLLSFLQKIVGVNGRYDDEM